IPDEKPAPVAPEPKQPVWDPARQPVAEFVIGANSVVKRPGNITSLDLNHSRQLLAAIPDPVKNELSDILGAICVTCALILEKDSAVKARQIKSLKKVAPEAVIRQILQLENELKDINPQLRLPILDLALPTLRQMSARHYAKFRELIRILVEADAELSLFEFALQEIITHRLETTFRRHKKEVVYRNIETLAVDAVNILSKLAHVGHPEEAAAQAAFNAGWAQLHINASTQDWDMLPDGKVSFSALRVALKRFSHSTPDVKKAFLDACAHCVLHDKKVTVEEAELLRAVAFALDIPLPPFLEAFED
ncbi:MAG: hypothetical protein P8X80_22160, partial [Desulfobacterales bacterium]